MYYSLMISYKKVTKYKYMLLKSVRCGTGINIPKAIKTDFITLTTNGILYVNKYYCWDGPSGPTIDTYTFVEPSLFHDALYQLIRTKLLPSAYRVVADRLLREQCVKLGMSEFRAFYVYWFVRLFGFLCVMSFKKSN